MKIFLAWSGKRSRAAAVTLQGWFPTVIPTLEPWMSLDIEKGARWTSELWKRLEESPVGLICLTRENLASPWLHFEAGVLARAQEATRVCTLLIPDLQPSQVLSPLNSFQHTTTEREDINHLLETINVAMNRSGDKAVPSAVLNAAFDRRWPALNKGLARIAASLPDESGTGHEFGELANQIGVQLQKAGLDASSVASGASLSEAPLEVQLSVRRLVGELQGGFQKLTKAQRAMVYGGGKSALFEMARALMAEHRWEDAARHLDEFTEVNPADWRAQKWRGIAHAMSRKGQAADAAALDAYKHAVAALPRNVDRNTKALLFNYRGSMYKRLGRYAEAEEDLRRALRVAGDELLKRDIHYNLACVYALTGRHSQAISHVRLLRHAAREQKLIRSHITDYFQSLSSDREFLRLIADRPQRSPNRKGALPNKALQPSSRARRKGRSKGHIGAARG